MPTVTGLSLVREEGEANHGQPNNWSEIDGGRRGQWQRGECGREKTPTVLVLNAGATMWRSNSEQGPPQPLLASSQSMASSLMGHPIRQETPIWEICPVQHPALGHIPSGLGGGDFSEPTTDALILSPLSPLFFFWYWWFDLFFLNNCAELGD